MYFLCFSYKLAKVPVHALNSFFCIFLFRYIAQICSVVMADLKIPSYETSLGLCCFVAYFLTNSNQSVLISKEASLQVCSFMSECQNFWPFLTSCWCCCFVSLPLLALLSLGTVSVSSILLPLPNPLNVLFQRVVL